MKMVASDIRRSFIVSTAGNYFGVPAEGDLSTLGLPVLEKFLDEASCRILCAQPTPSAANVGLKLTTDLPHDGNTLVFFKLSASPVTEENFHDLVQVSSTGGGDGSALIKALRLVWGPALKAAGVEQSFLKKLEEGLLGSKVVSSIAGEQLAWEKTEKDARRSNEKRIAEEAAETLRNMRVELEGAAASREGLGGLDEALETVSGYVDDLWKLDGPAYSEGRMKSLLEIVGNEVSSMVETLISAVQNNEGQARDEAVLAGATACEKWINASERLTGLFWPHQSLHPWKGAVYTPQKCAKLGKRLRQVAELRAQHRQLTRLLTSNERAALGTDALLRTFDDVQVGVGEDENDFDWERVKRRVEEGLAPAEERVAEKLRAQIAGTRGPTALAAEFRRYGELMKREGLRRALRGERETLLSTVSDLIDLCQAGPDTERLLDSPQVLQAVTAARASELRLEGLQKLSKELLDDLPGYEKAFSKISSALKDAEKKRQDLVEAWVNETKAAVAKKELTLGTDAAVVELTGASMMRVTYDPRLTRLIREARALSGRGVELPREVRELVERAGFLANRARALQQVATFHNTIGDRMVPSQRPLMLTAALELARAVREQSGVAWSDPQRVDAYTARLRELVRKFARQNSELAAKHSALRDSVANLLKGEGINLAGNQGAWKETLRNMRSTVDAVEAEYGNTKAWKLHWDRQLLKALGVAYRAALPALLRKLQEVRIELTFREGRLQWRPPLEEIRAKLYSGLRRFLAIPTNFRGVGDASDGQFGDLVQRSSYLYGGVYMEAEKALAAIETLRLNWMPLAAPARMDAGERLKGKSALGWEKAFKEAKLWAQEVGKLRGAEVKVSCITVETATTRSDLESASRRCWERLSSDLRAEASSRLAAVMELLSSASKELDRRPRTVEEVGLAHEAHARIQKDSSGVAAELEAVAGLARILAAWTREKLEGVSGARAAWGGLEDRLERHRSVVARQLEDARVNLRHRGAALLDDRERWEARWSEKPEVVTVEWVADMRERWVSLTQLRESLDMDCHRIGIDLKDILKDEEDSSARIELQLEAVEADCRLQSEFLQELKKQESEEWTVARRRLPRLHDWLDSWESRVQVQDQDQDQEEDKKREYETFVGKRVKEIRAAVEWVQLLRGDELAEEHWAELGPILGLPSSNLRDVTLGYLLNSASAIEEKVETVKEITKRAAAESSIRQALAELESWEGSASLHLQDSKDSRNTPILLVGEYGGLLARAGELRLLLEGARGAAGYERFAARAARWETTLSELEERVKALSAVQRKWVYLEPVYGGGAAPSDSGRWTRADKEFRYLMGEVARDPRVPALRRLPLPALTDLKDLLDRCQRSLDEFLEEKRSSYPRLYFLGDEDLLELVSGSGRGLEAHLPKLYPGVGTVLRENSQLTAVISPEGEVLKLPQPIDLNESLPEWLAALEEGIRNALRLSLEQCLNDPAPDPSQYPAQVLLLSERIRFTQRCERALREGYTPLKNLVDGLEAQRARYRGLEDSGNKLTALKARSLLLDTVHHLEVVRDLLKMSASGEKASWSWSRQIRSYKGIEGPTIRCAGAEFPYRFEYQGAAVGLVRTPLTERCFLALTQAIELGLGGSPTGPAGTGKTESVKALGAILGRLVLVFNCDEGMDAGSMRRILGGLAQAGAWGCFDEFNRLEEETLSAVAMLVGPLQEAVRDAAPHVHLTNTKVTLNRDCCVFITMNPAGTQYGGRHRLPDSLARLFRPVGMAHPDRQDIARALLECAGFLEAATLAKQLVETLDISMEMLSRQTHYDWGLRALRSVLDAVPPAGGSHGSEAARLVVALKAATIPKLTETDSSKFLELLSDVFPKTDPTTSSSTQEEDLQEMLETLCDSSGYDKELSGRCIQLSQQLQDRAGVAVVGPPGCGKTLLRRTLAEALTKIGRPVTQHLIYPGAVPKTRLLGRVDPRTREWKEGLLSGTVSLAGDSTTWIILDGDVEPGWAEALNSALDDNRLLTLPNGVGIRLGVGTRFIFETHRLDGASPATVSRLGVVHLGSRDPNSLLLSSRLEALPSTAQDIARTHLPTGVEVVLKKNHQRSSAAGLIDATLAHLQTARTPTMGLHALIVSLCGQIEDSRARDRLARLFYQITDSRCPDQRHPFAVLYNQETDRLDPFSDAVTSVDTEEGPLSLSGPVKRALETLKPWINSGHPVIVRGPPGCGKSMVISATLSSERGGEAAVSVRGSSLHGPQELITRLKRACVQVESSSHGRMYRPRNGRRLILILEDLHLASKDLQELTRQLLQEGGFHEEDLEFARLPLTAICTGDPTTPLHPRLEALLATHHLTKPGSRDSLAIAELHLKNALKSDELESWLPRMAPAMLDALRITSPASESEVNWTARDLADWADALRYYPTPEDGPEVNRHLLDAGCHLFFSRMSGKEQSQWESAVSAKLLDVKNLEDDVYVWKGGQSGLVPFARDQWRIEVQNAAARCAREGQPVDTKITSHLLQLVAGVSWALGSGRRGIVLGGRPGAGRRSSTRLAAALSSLRLVDAGPGKGKSAVRAAVQAAGVDGEPTLLVLEEHHVREEGLAVLASAVVSRGELPGLLAPEELDGLVAPLAELARREDFGGTLEQYLHHRLRSLLRVVMILDTSDVNQGWLERSGLLRHCTVVGPGVNREWWTLKEALFELALQQHDGGDAGEDNEGVKAVVKMHLRVATREQAPARFLALLHTWTELRKKWSEELESQLVSLEAGISRLREAGERVAKLEEEASKQRQELEAEKGRATAALEQITATMRGATGQRGEMTTLKAETERESIELARRKADIEGELGRVEPLVERAAQAVAGIGADALAEVRSLRAPPAPVRDVLEGVLRLMGIRDTSWNSMKTFLAKRGVKDEIRSWDARRSSASSLEAVEKLIKERPESFEEKTAKRASIAAAPLAAWVLANLQYGQILQQVAPLEREQRLLAERLAASEAQLGRLAEGLSSVESRVAQLQQQLAAHSRGAAALQLRSEATEASLEAARALLHKLDAEHRNWQLQFEQLTERKARLDVEAAKASGLLVYQNHSDEDKGQKEAVDLLTTERERLLWRAQGLPADSRSLVGAACALRGPLVPLFLDTSGVAVAWLRSHLGPKLEVTKPDEVRFLTTLELAVRFGKPLLVEELIELPSVLLPLLRLRPLRLGERSLPAQQGFRLFLATRRDRLDHLPGEADAVLTRVLLGAGKTSLAERLIEKALLKETPELEGERREALEHEEKLAGERDAARADLLTQLGAARGQDLLGEKDSQGGLLGSLEATQAKAKEIAAALEESRRDLEKVSKRAKEHEPLALFAANLFEAVGRLTSLSPLYVFSSEAFTDIYLKAIGEQISSHTEENGDRKPSATEKRLVVLTLHHCAGAAYRKHRLPLALHLALSLNPAQSIERDILLGEGPEINGDDVDHQVPGWVPEERRAAVCTLTSAFPEIESKMKPSWLQDINNIYADGTLTTFQKTLVVQALRPDHLHTSLSKLAAKLLGVRDIAPPSISLTKTSEEPRRRPVLLLLTPGADPGPELRALAAIPAKNVASFTEVSLGQGQLTQAEAALEEACREGGWVLLSNLQLALNWLPRLEGLLRSPMCTTDCHRNTRIWLTSEECPGFYPGLSGLCLKLAYEPPEGVKKNVKKSLLHLQQQLGPNNTSGILLLAWLHAILQERRRFVPQGWIRAYEWSEADLEAASKLVLGSIVKGRGELEKREEWAEGRGLLDVAVYGGRLQDSFDMRALQAIIRDVWSREVFSGQRTLGGVLQVPKAADPVQAVEQLNDIDHPLEYFGLPANAHRAWERSAAETALNLLKGIASKEAGNSSDDKKNLKSSNETFARLTKELKDLKERANPLQGTGELSLFSHDKSSLDNVANEGKPSPLNRFFADERRLTETLLHRVKLDVDTLQSNDTKTPRGWTKEWPSGPSEIIPFMKGLISRHSSLVSLVNNTSDANYPREMDLSWLSRPRAFFAALKQHTARNTGQPLEDLQLRASWKSDSDTENGEWKCTVILRSLFLSGAGIKDGHLLELEANAAPVMAAPPCRIAFVLDDSSDRNNRTAHETDGRKFEANTNWIEVPVYADLNRTELICALPVKCRREHRDDWLRRGVALHLRVP